MYSTLDPESLLQACEHSPESSAHAAHAFSPCIERNHNMHVQAHFNLGNMYRQCGQLEAAERCYYMVLEAAPGHWRALLNLSVALAGMGRSSEARLALRASFKASGVP